MTKMRIGKKKSTREEIGARNIDALGVETYGNEYLVYFLVQPDNIAVLSETAVKTKIMAMSSVIKGLDSIEFSCINSRENFDQNKMFYKERLEEEESPKVREILEKDLIWTGCRYRQLPQGSFCLSSAFATIIQKQMKCRQASAE